MRQRKLVRQAIEAGIDFATWLWAEHPLLILGVMAVVAAAVWWYAAR